MDYHGFFSSQLRLILTQLTLGESFGLNEELHSPRDVAEALVKCCLQNRGVVGVNNSCYSSILARKVILTHLKVLCSSKELFDDVPCAYRKCKDIFFAIKLFNCTVSSLSHKKYLQIGGRSFCHKNGTKDKVLRKINLHEIIEICTDARAGTVSVNITKNCSLGTILKIAEFEKSFIMAFIGVMVTLTSILEAPNSEVKDYLGNKPFLKVPNNFFVCFSPTESITSTWKDYCLGPDNHTASLKSLCTVTWRKLWIKVAGNLSFWTCGHLQDGQESKTLLSTLSEIICHTGK